ncbi:hypothetical protein GM661_01315 [Iocasia frigidifontis]|uniref:Arc-like DNA binding domain-containing protein n=1 Tax=Iocasia fonsfrigidae TaxID=2682810 RepID=A0A8A7K4V3_9FIRM|nr:MULTISPECIES: hypothetical protein [Halanaerobiaceae]AZO93769.1 hypothetical protein D7D81_03715 [Halocella sp. SP3-1]MTI58997.1 hypothetical protein [Bacillota bacterium]QTL96706.1 hypothetical protein GM661_01315 [Iocasia fonsfrigidae]
MPSLQVRDLPEHIYQKIVQLADAERRSITQETIVLLEKALEIEKQNKEHREVLFNSILNETNNNYQNHNVLDPVPLIREDRER